MEHRIFYNGQSLVPIQIIFRLPSGTSPLGVRSFLEKARQIGGSQSRNARLDMKPFLTGVFVAGVGFDLDETNNDLREHEEMLFIGWVREIGRRTIMDKIVADVIEAFAIEVWNGLGLTKPITILYADHVYTA